MQQCTSHSLLQVRGWRCDTAPQGAAFQLCHWLFSLLCVVSWAKVWNMTCPILISPINGNRAGKCAAPQWATKFRRSKWFGVAAHVPWFQPPWLSKIYFTTLSCAVFPLSVAWVAVVQWCLNPCSGRGANVMYFWYVTTSLSAIIHPICPLKVFFGVLPPYQFHLFPLHFC